MSATYCTYCPHKNYIINSFSPYNTLRALLIIVFIPTTVISITAADDWGNGSVSISSSS